MIEHIPKAEDRTERAFYRQTPDIASNENWPGAAEILTLASQTQHFVGEVDPCYDIAVTLSLLDQTSGPASEI